LKVIKNDKNFSIEKVERILFKEYYISEILSDHPNILKCLYSVADGILDTGSYVEPARYNVMEICKNGSLSRFVRGTGPIEETIAKFLFRQLTSAVYFMHEKKIAHFDIKLENILLDEYYNIKLADFGSAEIIASEGELFSYKKGTRCYMAPEVENCNETRKSYSAFKADVYSLGVCLHLLLLGEFPNMEEDSYISTEESEIEMEVDSNEESATKENCSLQSFKPTDLSSECRDILSMMIRKDSSSRCSILDVMQHPWLSEEVSELNMPSVVFEEFEARKSFILCKD
jgi:serine/threonine protein kinase